ncbi:MAG: zinc ribbon domain-containing protein [Treponema sp.]|jgi:hypothetical protein|nr:zinc ribbon domain-containing protein [Treponema sp.]
MFCEKCGMEIGNDAQFCPKCGVSIVSVTTVNTNEKKRHGFTSFYLIFTLICNAIVGTSYMFTPQMITQYYDISNELMMLYGLVSMGAVIGSILLLCWKKIGIWVFIGLSIVSLILNMAIGLNFIQSLWSLIGIAVMWGVLRIRKNGKTTWEQLE